MFKTLLVATVAGAGAANVPAPAPEAELTARSNNAPSYGRRPSYLCSNVNKKCPGPKAQASVTAYCSSLLRIPQVTRTKKTTLYSTGTTTTTKYVATVTQPAVIIESIVTSCADPAATTTTEAVETLTAEIKAKREAEPQRGYGQGSNTVHKPSCLSTYKKSAEVTSACKCAPITPKTTTVTSTYSKTVQSTSTVSATSTVTGDASTNYVFPPELTYVVANEDGNYYSTYSNIKDIESGVGFEDGSSDISNEILFQLNNANLVDTEGNIATELADEDDVSDTEDDIMVVPASPESLASGQYKPITCSVSYEPSDSTCPLVCQYSSAADMNLTPQLRGDLSWYLGPPNTVNGADTYKTYLVSRGESGGRGGGGRGGQRGSRGSRGSRGRRV